MHSSHRADKIQEKKFLDPAGCCTLWRHWLVQWGCQHTHWWPTMRAGNEALSTSTRWVSSGMGRGWLGAFVDRKNWGGLKMPEGMDPATVVAHWILSPPLQNALLLSSPSTVIKKWHAPRRSTATQTAYQRVSRKYFIFIFSCKLFEGPTTTGHSMPFLAHVH